MKKAIVLIGCSAVGKDTILEQVKNIKKIVSHTSRPIREGETQDKQYHFVTYDEMIRMKDNNEFIEMRSYHTFEGEWLYGVNKKEFKFLNGDKYILILDLNGLKQLEGYLGKENILSVYIDAPAETRLRRSLNRQNKKLSDEEVLEIARRLIDDEEKVKPAKEYCDFILENDKDMVVENIEFLNKIIERMY